MRELLSVRDKKIDLCIYRMQNAKDTLGAANLCMQNKLYKDVINRSYYTAFYAIKAVLALEEKDFRKINGILEENIEENLRKLSDKLGVK